MHWYGIADPFALPLAKLFRLFGAIGEIEQYKQGEDETTSALKAAMKSLGKKA